MKQTETRRRAREGGARPARFRSMMKRWTVVAFVKETHSVVKCSRVEVPREDAEGRPHRLTRVRMDFM